MSPTIPQEIAHLRRQEQFSDLGNRISDFIILDIVAARDFTQGVRWELGRKAGAQFRGEFPAEMIASIVGAQITIETAKRAEVARLRALPKPKRSVLRRRSVV